LQKNALSQLGTDARRAPEHCLVLCEDSLGNLLRRRDRKNREAVPGTHSLNGHEKAEPIALGSFKKTIEMDVVLPHLGIDQESDRLPRSRELRQCSTGSEDDVADTGNIDQQVVLRDLIDDAAQLADHGPLPAPAQLAKLLA